MLVRIVFEAEMEEKAKTHTGSLFLKLLVTWEPTGLDRHLCFSLLLSQRERGVDVRCADAGGQPCWGGACGWASSPVPQDGRAGAVLPGG